MSTTTDSAVAAWVDRLEVADAIYRYASAIDAFDDDGIRAVLDDDVTAQYGNNTDVLTGADAVLEFINAFTPDCIWQHHLLNVYHVDVEGDHAGALVYHTSHQLFERDPDLIHMIVARYHNELRRSNGSWKISKLYMEVLWAERRKDPTRYLQELGGSGVIWTRGG
jgi:hypothetical protein